MNFNRGGFSLRILYCTDYGRPVRKLPSLHGRNQNSHSQIFRYNQNIFCLPHRPKFSYFFYLCLHGVSVVGNIVHYNIHTIFTTFGLKELETAFTDFFSILFLTYKHESTYLCNMHFYKKIILLCAFQSNLFYT